MEVSVRGETFVLRSERALFWPRERMLVIADLHLGKSETFQQHGLWLPSQANEEDLKRIEKLAVATGAKHILFLGDLIHSRHGVTSELRSRFARWIDEFRGEVTIIIGNHDRHLLRTWPNEWVRASTVESWALDGFVFQHEPPNAEDLHRGEFFWVGHVHPVVRLQMGPDRLRLPSFVISASTGYLPAFSSLAGGHEMPRSRKNRVYPVTDEAVFAL